MVQVDETSYDNCIKKYGYAIGGQTPSHHRIMIRGTRVSSYYYCNGIK